MICKEKKQFIESKEGFCYVTSLVENSVTTRLLNFVPPKDAAKWTVIMQNSLRKIKLDQIDDMSSEFIDVDLLMNLYMD